MPTEIQPTYGEERLQYLADHYAPHHVIDAEAASEELRLFTCVVSTNAEMRQMTIQKLMSHLLQVDELQHMFKNLAKLAAIGLLIPLSTSDCERGFSNLKRNKTDL